MLAVLLGCAAALCGVSYFYIILERRPIQILCRSCDRLIPSNTPWVCGSCRQPNLNPLEHPFIHKCGNPGCGAEPKTYRCHHPDCQQFIYLTRDEDTVNYSYRFDSPEEVTDADRKVRRQKEDYDKSRDEHLEKWVEKNEELNLARVDEQLAYVRQRIRESKASGSANRLESAVESGAKARMELEEAARKLKAVYSEKYKNDKTAARRWSAAIDESVMRIKQELQ